MVGGVSNTDRGYASTQEPVKLSESEGATCWKGKSEGGVGRSGSCDRPPLSHEEGGSSHVKCDLGFRAFYRLRVPTPLHMQGSLACSLTEAWHVADIHYPLKTCSQIPPSHPLQDDGFSSHTSNATFYDLRYLNMQTDVVLTMTPVSRQQSSIPPGRPCVSTFRIVRYRILTHSYPFVDLA